MPYEVQLLEILKNDHNHVKYYNGQVAKNSEIRHSFPDSGRYGNRF